MRILLFDFPISQSYLGYLNEEFVSSVCPWMGRAQVEGRRGRKGGEGCREGEKEKPIVEARGREGKGIGKTDER